MNKKKFAIGLLILSVVGFVFSQNQKKKYLIFEERNSSKNYAKEFYVETGNKYMFSVWGTDEEGASQRWATFDATVKLTDENNSILQEKQITASDSDNDGTIRRATNGSDIRLIPEKNQKVLLSYTLVEGDYMDIEVYQNLPENAYWLPVLFIAIFLSGIVLWLKARNSEQNVNQKKTKS
jgi:hypothetical protein